MPNIYRISCELVLRYVDNPPNPYLSEHRDWLEPPPAARVEVYEERAGSILTQNDSPDVPFRWSVNPYRGCRHGCAYCYARTTHEYLGFGAGTDFETKLVAKVNAPALLRAAITKKSWRGEPISFSGVTDCYQPIEASYCITRACLEVCVEHANPASVVTRSFLVVRDTGLLRRLQDVWDADSDACVYMSIPFATDDLAKLIEPQAPPPSRRFEAMRRLTEAGVRVGVLAAPIIPGLNDREMPQILERAAAAGASSAGHIAVRLTGSVADVFLSRIRTVLPLRWQRIESRVREMRGGALTDTRFGHRMQGSGPYWDSIVDMFNVSARRFGLSTWDADCGRDAARSKPKRGGEMPKQEKFSIPRKSGPITEPQPPTPNVTKASSRADSFDQMMLPFG